MAMYKMNFAMEVRMDKHITEREKKIPVVAEADVAVVGGGIAGMCAAVAAARMGMKTALVERYGYLGGIMTAYPVPSLFQYGIPEQPLAGGIGAELVERCKEVGTWTPPEKGHDGLVDTEVQKLVMMEMLDESGVELFLHSWVVHVIKEEDAIGGIFIENKSGRQAIVAKQVIDASGDADLVALAGGAFRTPSDNDDGSKSDFKGRHSFFATMTDIDRERHEQFKKEQPEKYQKLLDKLRELGGVENYGLSRVTSGVRTLNGDCTDVHDLTMMELKSSVTTVRCMRFLKAEMPGYENVLIKSVSPQLGVRDTRRIVGLHRMTKAEAEEGVEYPDAVCRWNYNYKNIMGIPYRSMIPEQLDGVIVAGRAIDIERALYGYTRLIGPAFGMGHAAGVAATLCVQQDKRYRDLDVTELQDALRQQKAYLDRYEPMKREANTYDP
jgi:ribulose 1,5-bisphosphate synthetase/thiazole synthase